MRRTGVMLNCRSSERRVPEWLQWCQRTWHWSQGSRRGAFVLVTVGEQHLLIAPGCRWLRFFSASAADHTAKKGYDRNLNWAFLVFFFWYGFRATIELWLDMSLSKQGKVSWGGVGEAIPSENTVASRRYAHTLSGWRTTSIVLWVMGALTLMFLCNSEEVEWLPPGVWMWASQYFFNIRWMGWGLIHATRVLGVFSGHVVG